MLPEFLVKAASEVKTALANHDEKLVLAESCTGGLVATLLTSLPGISEYFCGSTVVYRWDTKMKWLGVQPETLEKYTDVSCETAEEMARGVLNHTPEATLSASITGHLGPNAPQQQDGLICIGVARRKKADADPSVELISVKSFLSDELIADSPIQLDPDLNLTLRQLRQLAAARQMLKSILAVLQK